MDRFAPGHDDDISGRASPHRLNGEEAVVLMPLFKAFKAPDAAVAISTGKDNFALGETITGNLFLTSQEDFVAKQIRVELCGVERLKVGAEPVGEESEGPIEDGEEPVEEEAEPIEEESEEPLEEERAETSQTRIYSSQSSYTQKGDIIEHPMHKGETVISERLGITKGYGQQFPFKITIPPDLGPTFQGMRRDGQWIERTWTLQGVVAVGGRPDVKATKDI